MNDPSSPEAIEVDVSVEDAPDKCQKCGIATNRYNRDLKKPICVVCSLGPAEAKEMAVRAVQFKKERGRIPALDSQDAWERRMAEGAAAFMRFRAEGRYE